MGNAVERTLRRITWRWWLGAALVAALAWISLRLARGPADATWERIQAERRFVVVTDASYPPFSAVDADGNLFGFDVDLAEEIGRRWGVQVAFENLTYDALLTALIVGRDDAVISAFVPQPERTREVAYTQPYFVAGTVAVVRAGGGDRLEGDPEAWAAGKTLAVEFGATGDALGRQWARRVVDVTVTPLLTAGEALAAVESGAADAALVDAITAYEFVRTHPAVVVAGPPVEPEPYVIAVSIDSPILLRELEAVLEAMRADGTLAGLRAKWFGEAAR
jgi:ABC-type amino acid transport substrate-binding protein